MVNFQTQLLSRSHFAILVDFSEIQMGGREGPLGWGCPQLILLPKSNKEL